ncbi:FtsX-like permease family protein [Nocardioides panacis]
MLLAGLWTRRGMNATSLAVCVIAVVAAVLGPMYARESAEHLLDTRLDERAPYTLGLTYSVPAQDGTDVPREDPAAFRAPTVDDLVAEASAPFRGPGVARFWSAGTAWALDPGGQFDRGDQRYVAPAYWRRGMCELAEVQGRCPSAAGEALVQATMARTLGLAAGDTFDVTYSDTYLRRGAGAPGGVEAQRPRTVSYRIVGTYRIADPASPAWFDLSRFTGLDDLVVPPQSGSGGAPTAPALLVAPVSMTSQTFRAGVDRPVDTAAVDLGTMDATEQAARDFKGAAIDAAAGSQTDLLADLDVASVFDRVRAERTALSRVMVAALAPLVLLTLLLLFALVSTAAQTRRPHVALAKLRGQSRGQVLRFALSEPFLVVAAAVPVGVGVAVAAAHLTARAWLHPGIPVALDTVTWAALALVVLAALAASTTAALAVVREPLAASLAASVRARPATRSSLVLRSAVVAVALAAVGNLLASGDQSSQLLALLTPMFVALAVAVGGAALLRVLARSWVRRTAAAGGTAAYLASRRLGRRPDVANLMVPLLLAAAVLTFAASTASASDAWRVARAEAEVGAARTFVTSATPGRLLRVTHEVDPDGRYLAAAATNTVGDDLSRSVFVDTARLARVVAWDDAWSDRSLASLQRDLVPTGRPVTFSGTDLLVDLADVSLRSRTGVRSSLRVHYVDGRGEQRDLTVGELRNGPHQVLEARLEGCTRECVLEQVYVTGSNVSVSDVQGELTIRSVEVDHRLASWHLDPDSWRPARPFPVSLVDPPVVLSAGTSGLRLQLYLGRLPDADGAQSAQVSGFARITPVGTPDVVPALVTRDTRTTSAAQRGSGIALAYPASTVAGVSLNGQPVPMRVVDRVSTLPLVGTEGSLADLPTALVEFEPPSGAVVTTQLLVAAGTPAAVLDRVRAAGVPLTDPRSLAATLHDLRTDAFSLGLRLFLVVGAATLLIAVFGVFASAVLQSRWRSYEVAALRVVGVSRRVLVRASVLEYVVLLGVAVLLGVLSAYLSLLLVLPSISLGTAGVHEPAPVYATPWAVVAGVAAALFVLATLIALLVSRRTTRRGRPSTLRWAEQG